MRRTKWNALAFLFSGALILAACGQQSGESAEPGGSEAAGGSQEPSAGGNAGTITMVVDGQITTLSNANADVPTANAYAFIGTGLYQYDATLTPVPDMAADLCEVDEAEIVWTCTLRDGLTFHNGDPVTAADVVFTYELARSANCRFNPSVCLAPFLESVTAIDDTTIEFTLLEPYAPFATVILPGIFIDSEAVVTAAYDEFVGEASGADAADVTAAIDAVTAATVGPDPGDRGTYILFADGAGAVVLSKSSDDGPGLLGWEFGCDGSASGLLGIPAGGSRLPVTAALLDEGQHYIKMAGREIYRRAVRIVVDSALNALRFADVSVEDVDWFAPHQANARIIEAAAARLGIPPERTLVNIDRYGNTSAASIPIILAEAADDGRLTDGDLVLLSGFGAGLTWGSVLLRWGTP